MPIIVSILFVFLILFITCFNILDKWRFRADRQYPYVKGLMEEWESVTLRLLMTTDSRIPDARITGQSHVWNVVSAANVLAAACPPLNENDSNAAPLVARQAELEEELDTFLDVYNGLADSYNKALGRPVIRHLAPLFHWQPWEHLNFNPN